MNTQKNTTPENRELNAAESLELIGRMIENTRNRMARNAGLPFLIWGYLTIAFTLAVYTAVACTHDERWTGLWVGLPLCGWLGMLCTWHRHPDEGNVRTFVDRAISQIWMVMGIVAFILTIFATTTALQLPIFFLIALLMGIGCSLTGLICRFVPSTIGGFISIVISPLFLIVHDNATNAALFIAAFTVMMIVPGHVMCYRSNRQAKQNHV